MNKLPLIYTEHTTQVFEQPKYKSKIIIGNNIIYNTHKFNWFNRIMIRLVFGFKIEKANENE